MSWGMLQQGCQRTGSVSWILAKSPGGKVPGQVYTSFPGSELRQWLLAKWKQNPLKLSYAPSHFLLPDATQFTQLTSCLGHALGVAVGLGWVGAEMNQTPPAHQDLQGGHEQCSRRQWLVSVIAKAQCVGLAGQSTMTGWGSDVLHVKEVFKTCVEWWVGFLSGGKEVHVNLYYNFLAEIFSLLGGWITRNVRVLAGFVSFGHPDTHSSP